MKSRVLKQAVPAIIMGGAAVVPVATTIAILDHAMSGGTTALSTSGSVATSSSASSSTGTSSTGSVRNGTYQGAVVNQPYGPVQATVTIAGKRISNVVISAPQNNPYSASVNQQAIPLLRNETLQAQSAQVNTVSGATLTSQAYGQSLQSALAKAGMSSGSSGSAATGAQHLSISGGSGGDGGGDW